MVSVYRLHYLLKRSWSRSVSFGADRTDAFITNETYQSPFLVYSVHRHSPHTVKTVLSLSSSLPLLYIVIFVSSLCIFMEKQTLLLRHSFLLLPLQPPLVVTEELQELWLSLLFLLALFSFPSQHLSKLFGSLLMVEGQYNTNYGFLEAFLQDSRTWLSRRPN